MDNVECGMCNENHLTPHTLVEKHIPAEVILEGVQRPTADSTWQLVALVRMVPERGGSIEK